MVGDCVRIMTFTAYARILPWAVADIKEVVDPFTGSFISRLPVTISCLRMAIHAADMFSKGSDSDDRDGEELIRVGAARLGEAITTLAEEKATRARYLHEKAGWNTYYDILDALEKGLAEHNEQAEALQVRTMELVESWRI
jgi:hypothetical protein